MLLWQAHYGQEVIFQPEDDKYSKYDGTKENDFSAFKDILDRGNPYWFTLNDEKGFVAGVDMLRGMFRVGEVTVPFSLENEPLHDRKLIYFRRYSQETIGGEPQEKKLLCYVVGYEGKNSKGKVEKKVIYIDGE